MRWSGPVIGLGVLGIGLALLSRVVAGRVMEGAGMAAFGLMGIVAAVDGMRHRRQPVAAATQRYATWHGTAAIWGSVAILLLGAALVAAGWVWTTGAEQNALALIAQRPGLVLVPFGIGFATNGVARWHGWRLTRSSLSPLVVTVGSRIGGAAAVMVGSVIALAGALELAAPSAFDGATIALRDALRSWLQGL